MRLSGINFRHERATRENDRQKRGKTWPNTSSPLPRRGEERLNLLPPPSPPEDDSTTASNHGSTKKRPSIGASLNLKLKLISRGLAARLCLLAKLALSPRFAYLSLAPSFREYLLPPSPRSKIRSGTIENDRTD